MSLDSNPGVPTHTHDPALRDLPLQVQNLPRLLFLVLIRAYQLTISKALPPDTCRFYPSCSHYGYQAVYHHGLIKGTLLASWRILRCNPFNPGGIDPVPGQFNPLSRFRKLLSSDKLNEN